MFIKLILSSIPLVCIVGSPIGLRQDLLVKSPSRTLRKSGDSRDIRFHRKVPNVNTCQSLNCQSLNCQSSTDPGRHIGQLIRVLSADHWSNRRWATIVAVIPSRERPCWLVEFSDGTPDVWPIHNHNNDSQFDYEFKENTVAKLTATPVSRN